MTLSSYNVSPAMSGLARTLFDSPIGPLTLVASDAGLQHLAFGDHAFDIETDNRAHPILKDTARQLDAYFAGEATTFEVPLDLQGTPFQQSVWTLLQTIPYGETTTYGALALQLGSLGKAQAVGLANAKNPVAILVPCHRVIGTSGALTGFAAGLDTKAFLLKLERKHRPQSMTLGQQADLFG